MCCIEPIVENENNEKSKLVTNNSLTKILFFKMTERFFLRLM